MAVLGLQFMCLIGGRCIRVWEFSCMASTLHVDFMFSILDD